MSPSPSPFCFCTLALGRSYRALALELAKDLERFSPSTPLVILTDDPADFQRQTNVLAFPHRQQSVGCYHDKRFVFRQALSLFPSCIWIDADMRILQPIPETLDWVVQPGITARVCESMGKKYAKVALGTASAETRKEYQITQTAAQTLGLTLEDETVQFVYEYLFCLTQDQGREQEFLRVWDGLAPLYERRGIFAGEGNAIGLAAAKAGLPVRWNTMEGVDFFMDRTEIIRIQKGQSDPTQMAPYFETQNRLKNPPRPLWQKAIARLRQRCDRAYRLLRLRLSH